MTPAPDTKKIAAEMREYANNRPIPPGTVAETLRAWADALDPQTMGIEEAIEVLKKEIRVAEHPTMQIVNERYHAAAKTIVAHYEATKAEAVRCPACRFRFVVRP